MLPLILSGPLVAFRGKCSKERIDPALPDSPPSTEIWSSDTSPPPAPPIVTPTPETFSRLASLLEESFDPVAMLPPPPPPASWPPRLVGDVLDGLRDLDGLVWLWPRIGDGGVPDVKHGWCDSSFDPLQLLFKGDEEEAGAGTRPPPPLVLEPCSAEGFNVNVGAFNASVGGVVANVVDGLADDELVVAAKLGEDDSKTEPIPPLPDAIVVDVLAVVAVTRQG